VVIFRKLNELCTTMCTVYLRVNYFEGFSFFNILNTDVLKHILFYKNLEDFSGLKTFDDIKYIIHKWSRGR
jgi:hypothetical protein